jgi:hypothetical protein
MNITSRTLGAVALGAGLLIGALLLAQKGPGVTAKDASGVATPDTVPDAGEYADMCQFCDNGDGGCYDYDHKGRPSGCTYPPCQPGKDSYDPVLEREKLACASCRAMCPGTKGGQNNPKEKEAPTPPK